MENKEKQIENFGDMVNAVEAITKPWRKAFWLSNIVWAIIVALLISYIYLVPSEMSQEQDITEQHQTQTYTEGATAGKLSLAKQKQKMRTGARRANRPQKPKARPKKRNAFSFSVMCMTSPISR